MRSIERRHLVLGAILVLALALRLRDPLSSSVIGAEDPYIHMERTWDLVQGRGLPENYPPGFAVLLAPFALLGPDVFYWVVRFLPPLLGVVEVFGVWVLCASYLRPAAAHTGAAVTAIMPENIIRTNLLFPTAVDLALLPFALLFTLRASEGDRRALGWLAAIVVFLLPIHPWFLGLLVPTLALFALVVGYHTGRLSPALLGVAGAAAAALAAVVAYLPSTYNPARALLDTAWPRLVELLTDPTSLYPLPPLVDLVAMLTLPVLLFALVGVWAAVSERSRFSFLALLWCAVVLPFVLVDWFDAWFIPHRSVVFLSVGVALLCALPVHVVSSRVEADRPARARATAWTLAALLLFTLPSAAATDPWYRLYDEKDYEAWQTVASHCPRFVVTGSWQARAGYRALTGQHAYFVPPFFTDPNTRHGFLERHPDLVVLVDDETRKNGFPTGFLEDWTVVDRRDDVTALMSPAATQGADPPWTTSGCFESPEREPMGAPPSNGTAEDAG